MGGAYVRIYFMNSAFKTQALNYCYKTFSHPSKINSNSDWSIVMAATYQVNLSENLKALWLRSTSDPSAIKNKV